MKAVLKRTARRGKVVTKRQTSGANPRPAIVSTPSAARQAVAVRLMPAIVDAIALLHEAIEQGRQDIAAGHTVGREPIDAAKTVLGMGGFGARTSHEPDAKDLREMTTDELKAFVAVAQAELAGARNATIEGDRPSEDIDIFS